jgi:Ca2+-binding RTX toxin-like protein
MVFQSGARAPAAGRCDTRTTTSDKEAYMAGRIRVGHRGGRVVVVLATAAYVSGLGLAMAPPAHTFGGSCNGRLSSVGLDASHEHGPVIIEGTNGADVIIGSRGDDIIHGNEGDDTICGGRGADDIAGGAGNDAVFGESGDDTIRGGTGNDLILGGDGNDDISGNADEDQLYGNRGDDIVNGVDGTDPGSNDKLKGGDGRNLCFVDAGDEVDDCRF